MSDFRTVEINGQKFEIDMRTAKTVDQYKIGDNVKVLVKQYQSYSSHPGVIVAFDNFNNLPTVTVAYLVLDYSGSNLKFAYINANEDADNKIEICPRHDETLEFQKSDVLARFQTEIDKKTAELREIGLKREYFEKHFAKYFQSTQGA